MAGTDGVDAQSIRREVERIRSTSNMMATAYGRDYAVFKMADQALTWTGLLLAIVFLAFVFATPATVAQLFHLGETEYQRLAGIAAIGSVILTIIQLVWR